MAAADRLEHLRDARGMGCTRCPLHQNRNHLVFGTGDPEAAIVVVGEGPGDLENRSGEPFVGPAGGLLDGMFRRVNLARGDVYICNMVKCRPPGNRNPEPEEVAACAPFLHLQLAIVQPRVIVAAGGVAGRYLAGESSDSSVGYLRNHDWMYRHDVTGLEVPLVVTYHPSYVLRNRHNPETAKRAARAIRDDLRKAVRIASGD